MLKLTEEAGGHSPHCGGPDVENPQDNKPKKKKVYRKPELKKLDPPAAIEKLKPLAHAGNKAPQRMIEALNKKRRTG